MKEKDKWIRNFRIRMKGYSEPAPDGLWEQLEKELDAEPRVIPMWRRWHAVAAVALVVLVSSLTVWFWQSPSANYLERQSAELEGLREPDGAMAEMDILNEPVIQAIPVVASETARRVKKMVRTVIRGEVEGGQELPENKEAEEVNLATTEVKTQAVEKAVAEQNRQRPAGRSAYSAGKMTDAYAALHKKKDRKWSIGLSTGNGTFSSSTRMDGYLSLPNGTRNVMANSTNGTEAKSELDKLVLFNNLSEGKSGQSDIKYRMPVTFGASLRVDVSRDWAIETGITYTQLSSETRSGTERNNYGWEEKLHYVGIPLKVNRTIWSGKRFEVYASAGGMMEKCVSGKRNIVGSVSTSSDGADEHLSGGEEDIKVKPLQWSLSAAAGAQFKITESLGVYAEPGVVYYFDDGSHVNTIRKEHPFNFNMQLGVRFTLPK